MQAEYAVSPIDVIKVLNGNKISFVLVGLHGLGGWIDDPRGTQDVDVVVALRQVQKATRALKNAFPKLDVEDHDVVVRFRDPETRKVVIGVMKPVQTLYRETFKNVHEVNLKGQKYRIPSLEMALAMKFGAMLSPNRADEDKFQDAHDFILVVKTNPNVNTQKLTELGELVYGGGGARLAEMVRQVRAGEKLVL
jgi:hypothetical protein